MKEDNDSSDKLIQGWFDKIKPWQKDLFNRFYLGYVNDSEEETTLIKKYSDNLIREIPFNYLTVCPKLDALSTNNTPIKRIHTIYDVKNIGAITYEGPLAFDTTKLTIIYGSNGTGKSTYVNLLKNISSHRGGIPIKGDVFKKDIHSSAMISYESEFESEQIFRWSRDSTPSDALYGLEIFDSKSLDYYMDDGIVYLPKELIVLNRMSKFYDKFKNSLLMEQNMALEKFISPPVELIDVKLIKQYIEATDDSAINAILDVCWSDENEKELTDSQVVLNEIDPVEKANAIDLNIYQYSEVKKIISSLYDACSQTLLKISEFNEDVIELRKAADIMEKKILTVEFSDIGGDVWKRLWEAAQDYSTNFMYPNEAYPYLGVDARCVLCQQPLSASAVVRFQSLDEFVRSKVNISLVEMNNKIEDCKKILADLFNWNELEIQLLKAKIDPRWIRVIELVYNKLSAWKDKILMVCLTEPGYLRFIVKILISAIEGHISHITKQRDIHLLAAKNRQLLVKQVNDMLGKKWVFQNKESIKIKSLCNKIQNIIKQTPTNSITIQVGKLEKLLITDAFTHVFNERLKSVGARRVKVIPHSVPKKGMGALKIVVDDSQHNGCSDILSEGEKKAVAFAAFFAEIKMKGSYAPIIFDDPTSSLDDQYEGNVIREIARLSQPEQDGSNRQVIVFTHRLPVVSYFIDFLGENLETLMLSEDNAGHIIRDFKPFTKAKDYIKVVNRYYDDYHNEGDANQKIIKKTILEEKIREFLEKLVENVLFDDIVNRFGRVVATSKLPRIKALTSEDVKILDEYMSKYSWPKHDQPPESPKKNYSDEEIHDDIKTLDDWMRDYGSRKNKIQNDRKSYGELYI